MYRLLFDLKDSNYFLFKIRFIFVFQDDVMRPCNVAQWQCGKYCEIYKYLHAQARVFYSIVSWQNNQ